ncbi:MAG: 2-phospho-L-lactate transferase [Armatimonadetes bacterium]|nr:2-phospho-L-lactate transferase [Armatimonadota bacterium]
MSPRSSATRVTALAGGVGGARLAHGLYKVLGPDELTVIGNTADDFNHFGLHVSPDLDTVMYTLAGEANPETGWGVRGDTFACMETLKRYGEPDWFRLGDRDLATNLLRTRMLGEGHRLTEVTRHLCKALGVRAALIPMSDEQVASWIMTRAGERLAFQEYFVKRHHQDPVRSVELEGIADARPPAEAREALGAADVIVLCPSNPFVSIGPILAVPGMREALRAAPARKIAVCPTVGGQALRGPAADMLASMGHEPGAVGIARMYRGIVDVLVIDPADASLSEAVRAEGVEPLIIPSVMHGEAERVQLATAVLDHAMGVRS